MAADGGWTRTLATFGAPAGCPLDPERLALALHYNGTQAEAPYLARDEVPGMGTDPNTMRTDILMGGNDVTGAGELRFTGQGAAENSLDLSRTRMANAFYDDQTAGGACPTDARGGRSATGEWLVCRGGTWQYQKVAKSSTSTCAAANDGVIRWNDSTNKGEYCDGAGGSLTWRPFSATSPAMFCKSISSFEWSGCDATIEYPPEYWPVSPPSLSKLFGSIIDTKSSATCGVAKGVYYVDWNGLTDLTTCACVFRWYWVPHVYFRAGQCVSVE